jgi:hypothetical protein
LTPAKDADDIVELGESLLEDDPVLARQVAATAVCNCPESRRAHLLLGRASAALDLGREAVLEFEMAVLLSETEVEAVCARQMAEEEAARIQLRIGPLIEVCRWAYGFPICVPPDWIEVAADGVDPASSRIFTSRPSTVLGWDPVEMVLATEVPAPDFSGLIEIAGGRAGDRETQMALYESSVPELFEALLDATVQSIQLRHTQYLTIVRSSVTGEMDDAKFVQEHMFVIPMDESGPGDALLVLVSYLQCHELWMHGVCDAIFELLINGSDPPV